MVEALLGEPEGLRSLQGEGFGRTSTFGYSDQPSSFPYVRRVLRCPFLLRLTGVMVCRKFSTRGVRGAAVVLSKSVHARPLHGGAESRTAGDVSSGGRILPAGRSSDWFLLLERRRKGRVLWPGLPFVWHMEPSTQCSSCGLHYGDSGIVSSNGGCRRPGSRPGPGRRGAVAPLSFYITGCFIFDVVIQNLLLSAMG